MGRYMKYEIKGSYKFILGVIAIFLILNTISYIKISSDYIRFIAYMILFGTSLAAFLYIVGSFKNELYEDRGYLTFTLPLTGREILGSKLIVAMMWFAILGTIVFLHNLFMMSWISKVSLSEILEYFSSVDINIIKMFLYCMMLLIIGVIITLLLIYFSMALSRVSLKNKKIGGIWFVVFLVLSIVFFYFLAKITSWIPYSIDMSTFKVVVPLNGSIFNLNIAGFIYTIVVGVGVFLTTGYIIDNKIDL